MLVVGGGPAGSAAAHVLASAGHDVVVAERLPDDAPRPGDHVLTPRAVAELAAIGVDGLAGAHRLDGVVLTTAHRRAEHGWPDHPSLPDHALVARRGVFDEHLAGAVRAAGATRLDGHEASSALVERGFIRGALLVGPDGATRPVRSRFLLVADGANSRFGRSIGTFRRPDWPHVAALRGEWSTPRGADAFAEVRLDLAGRDGSTLTGLGWVAPLGDDTATIGVAVWSTSHEYRSVNPAELLARFVEDLAPDWGFDPERPVVAPAGGRVPVGGSVGPTAGPAHLVVGDAAGSANPFTGTGVDEALRTGRLAGEVLAEALTSNDPTALQRYPAAVDAEVGTYFQVGRLADRFAGRPAVVRSGGRLLTKRRWAAEAALRIGLGALRTHDGGTPERLYRLARMVSRVAPAT